jgi:hypothetical protein
MTPVERIWFGKNIEVKRKGWKQGRRSTEGEGRTATSSMRFMQSNLQHSKAATAVVCQQLADGVSDVACVQEYWVYRGQMSSMTSPGGTVILLHPKARSCIFIRKIINALPLLQFCSHGENGLSCGGNCLELVIASACLPHDSDQPSRRKKVKDVSDYCHGRKTLLIIGSDARTHHRSQGSTRTCPREGSFMEHLVS